MAQAGKVDWIQRSVGVLSLSDRAIITVSGDDAIFTVSEAELDHLPRRLFFQLRPD